MPCLHPLLSHKGTMVDGGHSHEDMAVVAAPDMEVEVVMAEVTVTVGVHVVAAAVMQLAPAEA